MIKNFLTIFIVALIFIWANSVTEIAGQKKVATPPVKKGAKKDSSQKFVLTKADDAFLEDLERRSFQYLWEQSDARTGLTLDRARTDGTPLPKNHPSYNIGSSAATGFSLTALCIAAKRNWVTTEQAKNRAR